jgi:hypothetical protein
LVPRCNGDEVGGPEMWLGSWGVQGREELSLQASRWLAAAGVVEVEATRVTSGVAAGCIEMRASG